jgi:hypothetical protein
VLCSAITAAHLALGMPDGMLHVYEIQDLLDQVIEQQAKTVDKFSKSWQPENQEFSDNLNGAKSDGERHTLLSCSQQYTIVCCMLCFTTRTFAYEHLSVSSAAATAPHQELRQC